MTAEKPDKFRFVIEGNAENRADLEVLRPIIEKFGLRLKEKKTRPNAAGFFTNQLNLLYDLAEEVEQIYPDQKDRKRGAGILVNKLWKEKTERTTKSDKGGSQKILERIVSSGRDARRIGAALQNRVDYWRNVIDAEKTLDIHVEKITNIEIAKRFVEPAETKKGHKGRPEKWLLRNDRTIIIEARMGITRISIVDNTLSYFHKYGDMILSDDILDALLDNGGKN